MPRSATADIGATWPACTQRERLLNIANMAVE